MHMNYGGNLHNTLENLMLMSAGEDQDVVNELIANKDNRVLDYQYFVPGGGAHPISKPDRLVLVGQEYRPPFYGHVILMGLRDHLLSPWSTGYEGTGIESLYPSNTDMLRKAKAQNATTDYAHSFGGDADPLQSAELGQAKGFIVDAALEDRRRHRVVVLGARTVLPVVRGAQQRTAHHRHGRRGLDERPPRQQAGGIVAHLRLHGRQRARRARVDGRPARRPRVHEHRSADRPDDQRPDAG